MFFLSRINFPKSGSSTLEHKGRLVGPIPVSRKLQGRRVAYQSRFIDIGPRWSSVWCAVQGGLHSKRTFRRKDPMDRRLQWKPIARGYQSLYVSELTRGLHNKRVPRPRLRATNPEMGRITQRSLHDGYYFKGPSRFNRGPYYPSTDGRVF
ncbi:hypothetical protein XU18_0524 [Perkinsela sp. CCAP 1560/4]|nr:hypothetical protein XU18_0524 [Perkinsela sp. CCAP 1560/4]|eukprot:KNH09246.1 hypothetical protein XU18_0524 [Perkinsela sp. CCAP 1560/4]